MTSDMHEVDTALNASRTASEALMSATVIGEQKKADLDNRLLASANAIKAARDAQAELEAMKNHSGDLRVLQEKAATTNQKSADMLKTTADLIAAVGFVGMIGSPIDEWKECRTTIDRFDKILVDLRKTGFGFVTAIAAAAQFLFTDVNAFGAKAALLAMLVVLIITLYLIDLQHQEWLDITVERAKEIERDRFSRAIRLTNDISARFSPRLATRVGLTLYIVLLAATCAVFYFSVPRNEILLSGHHSFVLWAFVVGAAFLWTLPRWMRARNVANQP